MQTQKIIFFAAAAVYAVTVAVVLFLSKKPIKTLVTSAAIGLLSLVAVTLCEKFTGVKIPINIWTVSTSAALSLPGTILLLAINFIMG